jgi:hypothetical protein
MLLRADTQLSYGLPDQSPALDDVRESLDAIVGERSHQLFFDPEVSVTLRGHIQGIARLPVAQGTPWFVLSKSQTGDAQHAGFLWIKYPDSESQGEAFAEERAPGTPGTGQLARFWGRGRSPHPGGLAQCGHVLAAAQDPEQGFAFVSLIDGRDPSHPAFMGQLVLDDTALTSPPPTLPSEGEQGLSCVAITRLADGHSLLFAYRYSANSGHYHAYLFRSEQATLTAATSWKHLTTLTRGHGLPNNWEPQIENVAFLNQRDGGIFVAALYGGPIRSHVDLYQLVGSNVAELALERRSAKTLHTMLGGGTLRAGGALHITPSRKLVVYAVQKEHGDAIGNMLIEEFTR